MKAFLVLGLAVILAPGLAAQRDSMRAPRDSAQAEQLRMQIEQRFTARVQQELSLTNDQTAKLKDAQERFRPRRQALMQQQMQRRRALEQQMQPGVAANQDSVRKLMQGLDAGRMEMVRIQQDESKELGNFLNPVQQYRYNQMRERLMARVGEMRRQGQGRGMRRGQAMGMRMRGMRMRGLRMRTWRRGI